MKSDSFSSVRIITSNIVLLDKLQTNAMPKASASRLKTTSKQFQICGKALG